MVAEHLGGLCACKGHFKQRGHERVHAVLGVRLFCSLSQRPYEEGEGYARGRSIVVRKRLDSRP